MLLLQEEDVVLHQEGRRDRFRGELQNAVIKEVVLVIAVKENPFSKTAALKAQRKIANVATKDILLKYDKKMRLSAFFLFSLVLLARNSYYEKASSFSTTNGFWQYIFPNR